MTERSFSRARKSYSGDGIARPQVRYLKELVPKMLGTKKTPERSFFRARNPGSYVRKRSSQRSMGIVHMCNMWMVRLEQAFHIIIRDGKWNNNENI